MNDKIDITIRNCYEHVGWTNKLSIITRKLIKNCREVHRYGDDTK